MNKSEKCLLNVQNFYECIKHLHFRSLTQVLRPYEKHHSLHLHTHTHR
ncbi:hypothetical protein [Plasmodium yoelii yoelii]|uniref:Uncharacterized protein n=1 Tax=Plasmodium yoelii yoelii TaxID=73239 RepID=Q7R7W3_PLAYO|nr:hypothetical protein [Plasmodium yoelii yoelii]